MILAAVPATLCGALLGYLLHPAASQQAPEPPRHERPAENARSAQDTAVIARLRAQVRDLERRLAEASAKTKETPVAAEPVKERPRNPFLGGEPPRMPTAAEMRANMEELRKTDPERYTQMTNRFARWHEHRLQRTVNRLDILASVNTSGMSDAERETHTRLQDLMARQEELRTMLNPQNEEITEDQRRKTFDELRSLSRQIQQLETSERNTLLAQTAYSLGLSGDTATEMIETVKAIYQATQSGGGHHFGPPPGGPPRR